MKANSKENGEGDAVKRTMNVGREGEKDGTCDLE
jgi:hypothetical protein